MFKNALKGRVAGRALLGLAIMGSSAAGATQAHAQDIVVNATDTGWYRNDGSHSPGNTNFITGNNGSGVFRNWAVYDLPDGVVITGATVNVYSFSVAGTPTILVHDVSTPIAQLTAGQTAGPTGQGFYLDLGTGELFGQRAYSLADSDAFRTISLNSAAIASLNAANGGLWALGMRSQNESTVAYAFGFSGGTGSLYQLQLTTGPLSSDITGSGLFLTSGLGTSVNPAFRGGTLTGAAAGTFGQDFTVSSQTGSTINAGGFALIFNGAFTNSLAGTPGNLTVTGPGSVSFGGQFGTALDPFGTLTNSGVVTFLSGSGGTFGAIVNSGTFTIEQGATLDDDLNNTGTFANSGAYTAAVNNSTASGVITNTATGVWTGAVLSNTDGAQITNAGTWNGVVTNAAGITNQAGAVWTGDILTNAVGAVITNQGQWNGTGATAGVITNDGTWTGNLATLAGGTLNNAGTITGQVTNAGILDSTGTITAGLINQTGGDAEIAGVVNGAVTNSGVLTVDANLNGNGVFTNNAAGRATIEAGAAWTGLTMVDNYSNQANGLLINGSLSTSGFMINRDNAVLSVGMGGSLTANAFTTLLGSQTTNSGTVNSSVTNGGTITNNAGATWNGTLSQGAQGATNNGTWNGSFGVSAGGSITNNGVWTNATTETAGITAGSFTNATGASYTGASILVFGSNAVLTNNGSITLNVAPALLTIGSGGTFTNNNTGSGGLSVLTGSSATNALGAGWTGAVSNAGTLTNNGTLTGLVTNSGGLTSTGTITAGLTNQAAGTASVAGVLNGALSNAGSLTITGNTTSSGSLTMTGAAVATVNAGATWTLAGGVTTSSSVLNGLTINGALSTGSAGLVVLPNASVLVGATGSLTIPDDATVRRLSVNAGARVTNQGSVTGGVTGASGSTVTNNGTWTGIYNGSAGSTFVNTGTWQIGATSFAHGIGGSGSNTGTMTGTSVAVLGAAGHFINEGTVDHSAFPAYFSRGSGGGLLENRATWLGLVGADGAGSRFLNSGSVTGNLNLQNGGTGTNALTGTISGAATVAATSSLINAGAIGGLVTNAGALTNTGTLNGGLSNTGTAQVRGAVNGAVNNSGAGALTVTGALTSTGALTNAGTGVVTVNAGATWTGLTGISNTSSAAGGVTVNGALTTGGALTNGAGAFVVVNAGGVLTAADIANAATGTITVNAGGTINDDLANSGVVTNAGAYNADVNNTGADAAITNAATGVWTGALLSNTGGASVVNAGQWTGAAASAATVANLAGATWTGVGANQADGALTNAGAWVGAIGNAGAFTNQAGGTVSGLLTNTAGTAGNAGVLNGGAAVTGGSLTTTGTLNGGVSVGAAGSVFAAGAMSGAVTNAGQFFVTGALTGGGGSFTNQGTGLLGNAAGVYSGLGAISNAAGGRIVIGAGSTAATITGASLNNAGAVQMANGLTGDRVILTGAYTGAAGATLTADVNMASNGNLSDRLSAAGASGVTAVSLQNVGGSRIYFGQPIVVVAGGGTAFTAASDAATTAALSDNGLIQFRAGVIPGTNDWGLISTVNPGLVGALGSDLLSFASYGRAGLQPAPEQLTAGEIGAPEGTGRIWARASHQEYDVTATVQRNDIAGGAFLQENALSADGLMVGGSLRLFAGDVSSFDAGIAVGYVEADLDRPGAATAYEMISYGAYAVATAGPLRFDVQYDQLRIDAQAAPAISSRSFGSEGGALRGGISARIAAGSAGSVEPFVRAETLRLDVESLPLAGSVGEAGFEDIEADLIQAGVRARFGLIRGNWMITPTAGLIVSQEDGASSIRFSPAAGVGGVDFTTLRDGVFADVELGVTLTQAASGLELYAEAEGRFGDEVSGQGIMVGARLPF